MNSSIDTKKAICDIMREKTNSYCSDCSDSCALYVDMINKIFLCQNCAMIHKQFGFKVKNVATDDFSLEEIETLKTTNNQLFNNQWMALYNNDSQKIPFGASFTERISFLEDKYLTKKWFSPFYMNNFSFDKKNFQIEEYSDGFEQQSPFASSSDQSDFSDIGSPCEQPFFGMNFQPNEIEVPSIQIISSDQMQNTSMLIQQHQNQDDTFNQKLSFGKQQPANQKMNFGFDQTQSSQSSFIQPQSIQFGSRQQQSDKHSVIKPQRMRSENQQQQIIKPQIMISVNQQQQQPQLQQIPQPLGMPSINQQQLLPQPSAMPFTNQQQQMPQPSAMSFANQQQQQRMMTGQPQPSAMSFTNQQQQIPHLQTNAFDRMQQYQQQPESRIRRHMEQQQAMQPHYYYYQQQQQSRYNQVQILESISQIGPQQGRQNYPNHTNDISDLVRNQPFIQNSFVSQSVNSNSNPFDAQQSNQILNSNSNPFENQKTNSNQNQNSNDT